MSQLSTYNLSNWNVSLTRFHSLLVRDSLSSSVGLIQNSFQYGKKEETNGSRGQLSNGGKVEGIRRIEISKKVIALIPFFVDEKIGLIMSRKSMRVGEVRFLVQTDYEYLNNRAFLKYGWLVYFFISYIIKFLSWITKPCFITTLVMLLFWVNIPFCK